MQGYSLWTLLAKKNLMRLRISMNKRIMEDLKVK